MPGRSSRLRRLPSGLLPAVLALSLLVLGALALRLWGIRYGLPHVYHTDEIFEVKRALKLGAGQFDFHRAFKGGLYYLLFMEYAVYYAWLRLGGSIRSSYDFLVLFFRDPTGFWMIGRSTVAVIGAATAVPVFLLARRLAGRTIAGIAAALFLAMSFDHVWSSHFTTVDVPMVALLAVAFLFLERAAHENGMRAILVASIFAALATATKLPAIVSLVPLAIVSLARPAAVSLARPATRPAAVSRLRRLALAALVFAVVTAIVNPGFYPEILRLAGSRLGLATPPPQPPDDPYPLRTENVWIYYLVSIVHSLGLPIVALSAGGAVLAIRRRTMIDVSLLAFAVALYLFVCLPWSEDLIYPRYTLPIQLVLVLFAGWFVSWLLQWSFLVRRQKLAAPAAAVLLGLVALPPAIASLRYDAGASRPDSRTIARQWIVEHLPPESRILIEGRGYQTSTGTVPLVNRPENIEALVARFRSADARWSGKAAGGGEDSGSAGYGAGPGSGSDSYAPLKDRFHRAAVDAAASTRSFDLILFGTETLSYRRLSEYIEDGADYVVIEKDRMEKMREPGNAARFPEAARFYEDVASNGDLELMREFVPSAGGLGPVLRLYQVLRGDPDGAGSPGRR